MTRLFDLLTPEWKEQLRDLENQIDLIDRRLATNQDYLPVRENIFKALLPLRESKVLILGQDPYPNPLHAMGLAFSVQPGVSPLPASLRNIFTELHQDLGNPLRVNGDLSDWRDQGVVLLNRSLSVSSGSINSHANLGWNVVTGKIVESLANAGAIAVLWGKSAQQLSKYFSPMQRIESTHPSPLSAYRGFFGSKPFSRVNQKLTERDQPPILWG